MTGVGRRNEAGGLPGILATPNNPVGKIEGRPQRVIAAGNQYDLRRNGFDRNGGLARGVSESLRARWKSPR